MAIRESEIPGLFAGAALTFHLYAATQYLEAATVSQALSSQGRSGENKVPELKELAGGTGLPWSCGSHGSKTASLRPKHKEQTIRY